ncbi:MAG: phospho-N-acetylmuramoyl-pentapeptide-transferase [Phycisphaerae bacterium]|nr:phospho-N-acetylmuramoyl-pentapeptide-transferase [Phycisphaerae bacterium]
MIFNLIMYFREALQEAGLWRFLQVFQWPEFRILCALILTFGLVVFFGRRTIRLLVRLKIGDHPEFHHADLNRMTRQKSATPTMGGVLIAVSILLATLLLADMTNFYIQMALICLVWLAVIGGVDDWLKLTSARRVPGSREGLYMWEKLVFQVAIALLLGFFVHHYGTNNPETRVFNVLNMLFQRTYDPHQDFNLSQDLIVLGPWAFGIMSVFVIAGSSNAVNLTDGMDGLASGIMGIISFSFIVLCLISGTGEWSTRMLVPYVPTSAELGVVAGAMTGACLGFLWFNCHPAQVFMGDTGSLPLGGLIGFIAVAIRQEMLLLIIGGVLVAEALSVILQVGYFKASGGSRLFRCAPIHHHFHLAGWTEQQVVVRFWLITALLTAFALATLKLR